MPSSFVSFSIAGDFSSGSERGMQRTSRIIHRPRPGAIHQESLDFPQESRAGFGFTPPRVFFTSRSEDAGARARAEFESTALVHAKSLLRFAVRMVRDAHRAEDLVQETLLSAWRHFHQFERGTNCRAWLFRILINARNREFNKRSALAEVISIDEVQVPAPETVSSSVEILSALDHLSGEHREILMLGVVEGFSIKELSSILDVPTGTVMSRLSRARARLRELLSPVETMVGA
jgi:RNA polymerase sigma-70 factor, ECF subfamily